MTQIMKLRYLAPDIQEQILFLPSMKGLNQRNLRPVVSRIDRDEQRRLFQKIADRCSAGSHNLSDAAPELGRTALRRSNSANPK